LTYKKLQILVGLCRLFIGDLPVISSNIYGSGLLKVAGGGRIFTPGGWNEILRGRNGGQAENACRGMDENRAGIDGPVLGAGKRG
jgi:hypothetical protein